ncbi:hypothetical protein DL771_007538 [Monosporascus sp. 5C6A]|nr:hypothetical protein DL771_007538 [Monosporascus sp. 5C6A]
MPGKTYLITGANRGLGRGLFDHYVAQSNNTLIAAVRNVEVAQTLLNVPRGEGTRVILVKIDSASKKDAFEAAETIKKQGIEFIDVVIAAAGIFKLNTIEDMPLEEFEEVLMINGISVLLLYKATLPLLRHSRDEKGPKLVQTDMGNMGARAAGMEKAPLTLDESSRNTAFIIDNATQGEHSGKFFDETIDRIHPW